MLVSREVSGTGPLAEQLNQGLECSHILDTRYKKTVMAVLLRHLMVIKLPRTYIVRNEL